MSFPQLGPPRMVQDRPILAKIRRKSLRCMDLPLGPLLGPLAVFGWSKRSKVRFELSDGPLPVGPWCELAAPLVQGRSEEIRGCSCGVAGWSVGVAVSLELGRCLWVEVSGRVPATFCRRVVLGARASRKPSGRRAGRRIFL